MSLYVPFTALLAIVLHERVRVGHALAALLATFGRLMLMHLPGGLVSGWNRGDFETLLCALLCAGHLTGTAISRAARAAGCWHRRKWR